MTQHYYTADLHLGHGKVAKIRGFQSTAEHDQTIMTSLAKALKEGDHLWILGDISGGKTEEYALGALFDYQVEYGVSLHLVPGNHDSIHPMHRHSERKHRQFRTVFDSVDSMGTFRHNRDKVLLSHFPYAGDRGEDRYPEYRLKDTGKPIVHGHTHSREQIGYSDKGSLQICVSLDAWGMKPVPKHELIKIMDNEIN